jgi:hypothetical protein
VGKGALSRRARHLSPSARLDGGHAFAFAQPTACELICFARKRNFMQRPATNWHDGQITKSLSSPSRKNILLSFSGKSSA